MSDTCFYLLFCGSWLLIGFVGMIILAIDDMRGKPYDKKYFELNVVPACLIIAMGYISIILVLIYLISKYCKAHQPFTKLIYKIANIGISDKTPQIKDNIDN